MQVYGSCFSVHAIEDLIRIFFKIWIRIKMYSYRDGERKRDSEENKVKVDIQMSNTDENDDTQKNYIDKKDDTMKKEEISTVDTLSNLVDQMCLTGDAKQLGTSVNYQSYEIKNTVMIPDWLKDCESPFSWHLEQERGLGPERTILRTLEKLDDLLIEEPEFSLQRFVSLLKLVLEYYIVGDLSKCYENMRIVDGCLEEEISRNDPLYQKVKLSLGHVVSATKAHVLFITGKEEESKKIGRCIIPTKIMADTDKAALSSMKARFFLYSGYENGEEVGVNFARKALELEPENAEWEYLLAKMLRQKRREVPFSTEVPRDELKLLESAVKRDKDPKYLVYLAQVYRECATQAFRQYRNHPNFRGQLQSSVELMAVKAFDYYKEALSLSPDSPAVLRRVGYGIMNLPKKFADYDLALKCLLQSLEISEHQMTLHVLGTFYHRYGNDNRKAVEYFERTAKAGSHAGLSDMIRVKWLLDRNYDPCPDFEIGLSWKMKKKYHTQLLAQLGGYYLFIKRDFCKAIDHFKQIIAEDKDSLCMTSFKSIFLRMNDPIDLYKYIANEALLLMQKHDCNNAVEPETSEEEEASSHPVNLGYVEDFLSLLSEVRPELMEMTPNPRLVPRLIQASRDIEANCNNRGRSNFRGRGRRNFSGSRGEEFYSGDQGGRGGRQDTNERRGRFSVANQREYRTETGGRGRGYSRPQQNQRWRERPRNDEREDRSQEDNRNWRKK